MGGSCGFSEGRDGVGEAGGGEESNGAGLAGVGGGVEPGDLVADVSEIFHLVADEDRAEAVAGELAKQVEEGLGRVHVQAIRGFVEDQDVGLGGHGAGQQHALLLPAAEAGEGAGGPRLDTFMRSHHRRTWAVAGPIQPKRRRAEIAMQAASRAVMGHCKSIVRCWGM